MTGGRVLVDTSAWIESIRAGGDERIGSAVAEATEDGRAVLCDMVLVELWNGAGSAADRRILQTLEKELECVPTTPEAWGLARDMARQLRGRGVTLPAADLVIAACAERHGLALLHNDAHFEELLKHRKRRS
ncbi:MAG: PIN domain-containing protein [Thermoanaerobaculia bacterium]